MSSSGYSSYWDDPLHDERQEALRARWEDDAPDDPREEYEPEDPGGRRHDPYAGTCPGCGQRVAPGLPGGSCLWKPPGPWHPACRAADPEWQAKYGPRRPD